MLWKLNENLCGDLIIITMWEGEGETAVSLCLEKWEATASTPIFSTFYWFQKFLLLSPSPVMPISPLRFLGIGVSRSSSASLLYMLAQSYMLTKLLGPCLVQSVQSSFAWTSPNSWGNWATLCSASTPTFMSWAKHTVSYHHNFCTGCICWITLPVQYSVILDLITTSSQTWSSKSTSSSWVNKASDFRTSFPLVVPTYNVTFQKLPSHCLLQSASLFPDGPAKLGHSLASLNVDRYKAESFLCKSLRRPVYNMNCKKWKYCSCISLSYTPSHLQTAESIKYRC